MILLPNGNRISEWRDDRVTFRIDNEGWACIYDIVDKIFIRCRRFGKVHEGVPDTHLHRAQETDAEQFVRIRPKRIYDIM